MGALGGCVLRRAGGWWRGEIELYPVVVDDLEHFDEVGVGCGFDEEGVCAELIGEVDIDGLGGGGEHDDDERAQGGLGTNPTEHIEAADLGKFDIEEDYGGEREILAVAESPGALEIVDRLPAVGDDV